MIRKKCLIAAALVFGCSFLSSEEPSPRTFDLAGAIRYAQQNNLRILALQKQQVVARSEVQVAKQRNNLSAVFETTRSAPKYFAGLSYPLEIGGKRDSRIEVASREAQISDLSLQSQWLTVRHDVRVAFYQVVLSRERQNEIAQARDLATKLQDVSRQRFDAGDVARVEVLQADLELKRAENDLKQEEDGQKISLIRLNALLNLQPDFEPEIKGSLEDQPGDVTLDLLLKDAMSRHVELLTLEQETKAEQARLSLARAERIPDLDIDGGAEIHDTDFNVGWKAGLTLELPIFNRKQGEIARSEALLEVLKIQETAARQQIGAEISEAFSRFKSAQVRIESYKKNILPAASEIEQMSEESYREGRTGILVVIDAQRNVRQVRLEYLDSLMDFQTAVADLELAAGVELQ